MFKKKCHSLNFSTSLGIWLFYTLVFHKFIDLFDKYLHSDTKLGDNRSVNYMWVCFCLNLTGALNNDPTA